MHAWQDQMKVLGVVLPMAVLPLGEDRGRKMSASGFPYAAARIQRADDMECAVRSAAAHKMGYEN